MRLLAFCHKGGVYLPLAGSIIMHLTIPLEQISVEDKLQAIEEIWADPRRHTREYTLSILARRCITR